MHWRVLNNPSSPKPSPETSPNPRTYNERSRNPRRTDRPRPARRGLGRGGRQPRRPRDSSPSAACKARASAAKPDIADYVLIHRTQKLAVIEAKAQRQARYRRASARPSAMPKLGLRFAFATNGLGIYRIDMQTGAEGYVARLSRPRTSSGPRPSPRHNAWRDRFAAVPFEDKGGTCRPATTSTIAINQRPGSHRRRPQPHPADPRHRHRQDLHRLPDRLEAVPQPLEPVGRADAGRAAHPVPRRPQHPRRPGLQRLLRLPRGRAGPHRPATHPQEGPGAEERQRLLHHLPDLHDRPRCQDGNPAPSFGDYPPDFFDFIVIDECHRGGANDESNWRGILEYFAPAVQLGLTATPKRKDNVDTYAYFGEPVYIYSLKEGINDGFLTPFKVRQIATTLDDYVYHPRRRRGGGRDRGGQALHGSTTSTASSRSRSARSYRVKVFMDADRPERKDPGLLRHPGPCAGGARPDQPDEDQHGPALLRPGHGQRRRTIGERWPCGSSRTTRRPSRPS